MVFLYTLIIVFLNSGSRTCFSQSLEDDTDLKELLWEDLRLPKSVIPLEYDIFLHPNLTTMDYSGKVEIKCEVRTATNFIVLHSKDLVISGLKLTTLPSNEEQKIRRQTEITHSDQLYFEVENYIPLDTEILITVDFYGHLLNHRGYGFYATEYLNKENETGIIASTQFEPISARRAFPCFDEPDLKAKFSMAIVRDRDYLSLFNMPRIHSMPYGENLMLDTFQQSVKMSTYLVAFAICNYASVSNQTKTGINVTFYAPRDKIEQADYALEVSVKALDYFSSLFDVPYPLPKLDMITIPYLGFGGMENWGLITLKSTSALYDPAAKVSYRTRFEIAKLVAHELAHQWFGNIVTMKWWNDIWLNEGFATFMSFMGLQAVNDIWNLESEFTPRIMSMYCEDLFTPHPLVQPVAIPDGAQFGCITYSKGASLVRMLRSFLGETDFDIGIKGYLKKHKFGAVVTDDLWQALSSSSKDRIKVKSVMETWVREPGYPVVTVSRQGAEVHVSQKRFVLLNNSHTAKGFQSGIKWNIPFVYGVLGYDGKITYNTTWLKDRSETITIRSDDKLVKGNYGESGYYRVNYDTETWKAITEQLNSNHQNTNSDGTKTSEVGGQHMRMSRRSSFTIVYDLSKIFSQGDRAQLLNDAFAFAGSGLVNMTLLLELTNYLENEGDYLPWYSIYRSGRFIRNKRNTTEFGLFKIQLCNILTKRQSEMINCDKNEKYPAHLCKLLDKIKDRLCPTKPSKKSKRYLLQRVRNEARIGQEGYISFIDDDMGDVHEREWPF